MSTTKLGDMLTFEARSAPRTPVLFTSHSGDALRFLCPVIGPTATLLLQKTSMYVVANVHQRATFETDQLARCFGVGREALSNALGRLSTFGFALCAPLSGTWYIATTVHHYAPRWIDRLPIYDQPAARALTEQVA